MTVTWLEVALGGSKKTSGTHAEAGQEEWSGHGLTDGRSTHTLIHSITHSTHGAERSVAQCTV